MFVTVRTRIYIKHTTTREYFKWSCISDAGMGTFQKQVNNFIFASVLVLLAILCADECADIYRLKWNVYILLTMPI